MVACPGRLEQFDRGARAQALQRGLERFGARRRERVGAEVERRDLERRPEDVRPRQEEHVGEQKAEKRRPEAALAVHAGPAAVLGQRKVLERERLDGHVAVPIVADVPACGRAMGAQHSTSSTQHVRMRG